jgi:hypothetical protein
VIKDTLWKSSRERSAFLCHSKSELYSSLPLTNASQMTTSAVTSVNSLLCHASTCFRIGSKFRYIRSTPPRMQSVSENDFECFAHTGVKVLMPAKGSRKLTIRSISPKQRLRVGGR